MSAQCKNMPVTSHGSYQGDIPINFSLPLLIIQMCIVISLTRFLAFLMKPLRQPSVVAEIIGGILLGPSALGRSSVYLDSIFPKKSLTVLETFANFGLIFFLFMVGLELDLNAVLRTGRQAVVISLAGIFAPFASGVGVSFVLRHTICKQGKLSAFVIFMGVAMSITAFPVLARILAERKLLTTDVGRLAMSAAAVDDVMAWIMLVLAVALSGDHGRPTVVIWVLLTSIAYLIIMLVVVRRFMNWVAHHVDEHGPLKEIIVCLCFVGVLVSSFCTEIIGIHSIFGAFVFGLMIPKEGPLAKILIEKLEDFIRGLMLPLYFVASGLKTNIRSIHGIRSVGLALLVITSACMGKILGVFFPALLYGIEPRKALTLGFLMNTKGLVELIVLNIGKERGVLNDETFAIMVIMALFTTFMTTPIVMAIYRPARNPVPYLLRTLEMCKPNNELRVLCCVHGAHNVTGMINLVDRTRGTNQQPMKLYVLHLVELTDRSSAIVMVHKARKDGKPFSSNQQQKNPTNPIYVAFEAFGRLSEVKIRPMTGISQFTDMHEDICDTAADRRACILLLPFHMIHKADGKSSTGIAASSDFHRVNQAVLKHSPCSVGIYVDRDELQVEPVPQQQQLVSTTIGGGTCAAVIFFGGPDDREALALGIRMAAHPGVTVHVLHFTSLSEDQASDASSSSMNKSILGFDTEIEFAKEKHADSEAVGKLPVHSEGCLEQESICYKRVFISGNPVECVVEAVRNSSYKLVILGRGCRVNKSKQGVEYEELGGVGSALAMPHPQLKASILVLQQYCAPGISASNKKVCSQV